MIVTVTLNPSLDRSIEVGRLERGEVNRATSASLEPGGKGVNVSRALLANGVPSRAVVPCGGDEGGQLIRLLVAEGVDVRAVPIAGPTRSNITLTEPDGTTTKINEPGPQLSPGEFAAITDQALAAAGPDGWVVACGSAPPGLPDPPPQGNEREPESQVPPLAFIAARGWGPTSLGVPGRSRKWPRCNLASVGSRSTGQRHSRRNR